MKQENYIKFNKYEIIKISLEQAEIFESEKDESVGHFYKILPLKEDLSEIETYQGIKFKGTEEMPYNIEIVLKANFSIFVEKQKMKEDMILFNIPAIQYPYLRSAISMVASLSNNNYNNIVLPTVNFFELMKDTKIKDLIIELEE